MPPGAFRGGPASGQFDAEGRRAAKPRFDSQPVQGVSSIKPGPTPGAWWALSDNGFGRKWNSPDYRLSLYLFDVRPRTQAGSDSRTALQAVIELSDPARFFPWRIIDENSPERVLTGAGWSPVEKRVESIAIKGAPDEKLEVRTTPHGPLVGALREKETRAVSFRWNYAAATDAKPCSG